MKDIVKERYPPIGFKQEVNLFRIFSIRANTIIAGPKVIHKYSR
jgi:hypothetical protein